MSTGRRYSELEIYRRLLTHARAYWPRMAGLFLLSLLSAPLALLAPVPLQLVVDHVVNGQPVPEYLLNWIPAAAHSGRGLLIFSVASVIALAVATQGVG